jgi:lysophospholipase L1-like esterase
VQERAGSRDDLLNRGANRQPRFVTPARGWARLVLLGYDRAQRMAKRQNTLLAHFRRSICSPFAPSFAIALVGLFILYLSQPCGAEPSLPPTDSQGKTVVSTPASLADRAEPRMDATSQLAHQQLLEKAKQGQIDVYFVGDSITRRWGTSDPQYKNLLANWSANFYGWNAADFGWGADSTQNILWRLENGELDGVNPKIIVILAGTNNVGSQPGDDAKVAEITRGLKAILDVCQEKAPAATIILTGIFPRNDNMAVMPTINKINENLAQFADGKKVRYLNANDRLANQDGKLFDGMMNAKDKLHPTAKGYQVWADGLKPIFTEILGPPAAVDHAPAATGAPSTPSASH